MANFGQVLDEGTDFDGKSVMEYPDNAFSKNGGKTITFTDPKYSFSERQNIQKELGQRYGFAASDVIEINNLYNCPPSVS